MASESETPAEILLSVTPWEFRLLLDLREGLTYRAIALRHQRNPQTVERTFERLRDKLRPWGGGSKGGLVHWIRHARRCLVGGMRGAQARRNRPPT